MTLHIAGGRMFKIFLSVYLKSKKKNVRLVSFFFSMNYISADLGRAFPSTTVSAFMLLKHL